MVQKYGGVGVRGSRQWVGGVLWLILADNGAEGGGGLA